MVGTFYRSQDGNKETHRTPRPTSPTPQFPAEDPKGPLNRERGRESRTKKICKCQFWYTEDNDDEIILEQNHWISVAVLLQIIKRRQSSKLNVGLNKHQPENLEATKNGTSEWL